ncbi:GFA family protein [Phenylobacterium sp.]|uniref:GFA family protein n=1 Tax=Phenylobacterium sp. TaxID=1871053 RepID=UPI0028121BA8|nr:GFA family protein [Phenylobacterium sp.]
MSQAREGACRCGQVRFRLTGAPLLTMACHCKGCQRMTAGPFSLSVLVTEDGFEVAAGEPVVGGAGSSDLDHYFCPRCMSWMFTRPKGIGPFVNVRTPLLDDPTGLDPFVETQTAEKLSWATTPAVESFERFPGPEDFGRLMAAFAERSHS